MKTNIAAVIGLLAIMALSIPQQSRGQETGAANQQPTGVAASTPNLPDTNKQENSNACTIIFFREGHVNGAALKPSIYLDGKELDRLANGRWLSVHTSPGKHDIKSSAKNEPATVIDVKEGETIYVQMVVVNGTWRGAGRLMQVDGADAKKAIAGLKPLHD